MVPVVYFVSVTLIVVPTAVSVKVGPTTLPTRWNGVPTAGIGAWMDLRMVSAPLMTFEMRELAPTPEIRWRR